MLHEKRIHFSKKNAATKLQFVEGYRYGYQGSEKDDEVKGAGNQYTTQFRQLDPRLGRWLSIDPEVQPWQSPYCSMDNNPIKLNDKLGLSAKETKDWIKNKKTGEFKWDKNVTSSSNTPKDFEYIGSKDSDITKNLFEKTYSEKSTTEIGLMASDEEKGTVGFYNGRIDTKLKITFSADVDTKYDSQGQIESKAFNGVNVFGSTVSYMSAAIPGGNPEYQLSDASLTMNGKKMNEFDGKGDYVREIGNLPSANTAFNTKISAVQIQKDFGKSFNINFKLNGLYSTDDKQIFMQPGAVGLVEVNRTHINLSIKFSNH